MFKLSFLLGAGLFTVMLIAGQDHGQQRFGLMPENALPALASQTMAIAESASVPKPTPVATKADFVPETPVMVQPSVQTAVQTETGDLPAAVSGTIMYVLPKSVNVRAGPGTDTAVLDRLTKGEAVLVVSQGEGPDGWSLIRIEGDGVEGYVAARLLAE